MGKHCSKCLHADKSINKHTQNTKPTDSNTKVIPMNSFILPGELKGFISHGRKVYSDVQKFYELGPILGHGSFGNVRVATLRNSKTTQQFAVKSIPKAKITKEIGLLVNELKILKMVDHPNIIKLYEVYEDDRYIHLVMEYCSGGELFERIIDQGTFSEYEAANLMAKLFHAINHLHSLRISHRDLKPENVLYTSKEPNADIKLVDFGLSSKFGDDKMHTIVGTCYYVAPEVLKQKYGPKCDLWSLGVMMYLLLAGKPPFVGKDKFEVFDKIRKSKYSLEGDVWNSISEEAKDLIRKLLNKNQKRRLSAVQALEHP